MTDTVAGYPDRKWDHVTWEQVFSSIDYLMCRVPAQSEELSSTKANYDPDMARNIIELFYERMRDDQPFDYHVLYYFMKHVFTEMVENKVSAEQAFGLERVKGQSNHQDTEQRDIQIAAEVALLLIVKKKSPQDNLRSVADINFIIYTLHGVSKSVKERVCKSFSSLTGLLPPSSLKPLVSKELSACADLALLAKSPGQNIQDLFEKQKALASSVAQTYGMPLKRFEDVSSHLSGLYSCSEDALKILASDEAIALSKNEKT